MWQLKDNNISIEELCNKILRMRPYFRKNSGGVTISGGEPLLQSKNLIPLLKRLKEENIHIALDTAGIYNEKYIDEILKYIDYILLDIKHIDEHQYKKLTGNDITIFENFIKILNKKDIPICIRQVIIPNLTDSLEYISNLAEYLKKIKNIVDVNFLPFHNMAKSKYEDLKLDYPYKDLESMDKIETDKLYNYFKKLYKF